MNNFPYYNHFALKLVFDESVMIDGELVEALAQKMVSGLDLMVVKTAEHLFDNGGLTRVYVLSESHLIIHTWPEMNAVHMDIMTCRRGVTEKDMVSVSNSFGAKEVRVVEQK